MKLAIVIVHYNSSADLDRCLESLVACAPRQEHEVVIVDNASRDEGLADVHRRYPDFTWIFSNENTGYSRGCNLGMARVEADYYLVLNPDIVVQPGALDNLLEFADAHPRAGMVGPQLLNDDGSIQHSCRRFYTFATLLLRRTFFGKIFPNSETVRLHLMQDFDHQSVRPVDWVLGGCLLVRKEAMDRTGPMDERFFLYFEDVDWCYRMWQAGYEVVYCPDARFIHRHRRESAQGKFSRTFWMHLGSLISFYEKWGMLVWLLKKWRDPMLVSLLWVADMLGLAAAFGAAYGLRGMIGALAPGLFAEPLYPFSEYQPLLFFSQLVATLTFLMTGRYQAGRHQEQGINGAHFKQIGTVSLLLMASSYLGHLEVVSRAVLLLFIPLLAGATLLGEMLFRSILKRLEKGRLSLERTLLVGGHGEIGDWLSTSSQMSETLLKQGVDIAGYLANSGHPGTGLPPLAGGMIPWLGEEKETLEVVKRYRISQVVFWQRPGQDPENWRLLARLRGLRVRLRWQIPDVWLLAAQPRTEMFGEKPSAVTGTSSAWLAAHLVGRLASVLLGAVALLTGWLPWLILKLVLVRSGRARIEKVKINDLWGHEPKVVLSLTDQGHSRSFFWQWRLAFALIQGKLGLTGPRGSLGKAPGVSGLERGSHPDPSHEFWRQQPAAPGLTGPWASRGCSGLAGVLNIMKQLWIDPGGFGTLNQDSPVGPSETNPTLDSENENREPIPGKEV